MARISELVFRADNRSAIRALTGIADASDKTTSKLKRDSRQNEASLGAATKSVGKVHSAAMGAMGVIGLGGMGLAITDVMKAGEQWQVQQAQLANALKNTGHFSREAMKQMLESADKMSTHGGFGESENIQGLTQFIRLTGNARDAISKVGLATDIARSSGRDFSQVLRALVMAEQGRTTGLARLGVAIPKVTSAQDALKSAQLQHKDQLSALTAAGYKFTAAQKAQYALAHQITPQMLAQAKAQDQLSTKQKVFALLQQRYGGGTAAFSKTTAGQISNHQHAWENLQKQIALGLLPVLNKLMSVTTSVMGWLNKHKVVLYGLMAATAGVALVIGTHAAAMELLKAKTYLATAAQKVFGTTVAEGAGVEEAAAASTGLLGAAMDALPIIAIIAGLTVMATHWKQTKQVATAVWHAIESAGKSVFGWIKRNWPLLAGILLAPFTLGGSLIFGIFHRQILGAAKDVWRWMQGAWKTLTHIITWPFQEAWKIIKGIANAIVGAFNWVMGKVKGVANFITGLPGKIGHGASSVLHTLSFGLLAGGGVVRPKYLAAGGPAGTDTVPGWLTPGEGVVSRRGMSVLGEGGLSALNHGGAPGGDQPIVLELHHTTMLPNGRVLAEEVTRQVLKAAARSANGMVGGGLASGMRT